MQGHVVVVPCFDEADRLDIAAFEALASRTSILFVDDGSTDRTAEVLAGLAARHPDAIEVLGLERNAGKGEAVRRGMLRAIEGGADVVGYLDADLATGTAEYLRLVETLTDGGADAVLGSRVGLLGWGIERSLVRHYLGRVFASLASAGLGLRVYDTQCGAKVFRSTSELRGALAVPFRSRWIFDVELIARLVAADPSYAIVEQPLRAWAEVGGSQLHRRAMAGALLDLLKLSAVLHRARNRS